MDIVAAAALLRTWILAGGGRAAPRPDNLDPALVLDTGIFRATGDNGIGLLVQGEPFAEVRIVAEVLGATSFCVVADGLDPVTGMSHRRTWVFEFAGGVLHRIVLTSSAQIPDKPYDGTFPLRTVAD